MKNIVLENEKVIQNEYYITACISVCYRGVFFSTRNGSIIVEKRGVSRRRSTRDSTRNELEVYKMLQK